MLVQGHTLTLLDEAWEVGHQRHPGPENQDRQHMLNQPRRFLPDYHSSQNHYTYEIISLQVN